MGRDGGGAGGSGWGPGLAGALLAGLGAVLLVWWLLPEPATRTPGAEPAAPGTAAGGAPQPAAPVAARDEVTLLSGETLELPAAALPRDRPLVLHLDLPVASVSDAPLDARVLTEGRDPLRTDGAVLAEDGRSARLEIDADWLTPGRYVVEIRTTERTHLPLRRYALEIR